MGPLIGKECEGWGGRGGVHVRVAGREALSIALGRICLHQYGPPHATFGQLCWIEQRRENKGEEETRLRDR